MSVPKYSSGHKAVQKANKQYPAVAYVNKKDAFANYTASQHSLLAAFSFFFFSLSTKQESVNSHLFLNILGFAIYHQTCTSTSASRQLAAGREEEDVADEVSARMLWKCSRSGQPDLRQEHGAKGSSC